MSLFVNSSGLLMINSTGQLSPCGPTDICYGKYQSVISGSAWTTPALISSCCGSLTSCSVDVAGQWVYDSPSTAHYWAVGNSCSGGTGGCTFTAPSVPQDFTSCSSGWSNTSTPPCGSSITLTAVCSGCPPFNAPNGTYTLTWQFFSGLVGEFAGYAYVNNDPTVGPIVVGCSLSYPAPVSCSSLLFAGNQTNLFAFSTILCPTVPGMFPFHTTWYCAYGLYSNYCNPGHYDNWTFSP